MARRKINRKPGHATAKANHDAWLRSMGINPDKKPTKRSLKGVNHVDLKVESNGVSTSDKICDNGSIKESQTYTGNEIMGITLLHKSSFEPIRKDNKQAAVDAAHMRRN